MKTCPFCAEAIQDAAIKCRYCGSELLGEGVLSNEIEGRAAPRALAPAGSALQPVAAAAMSLTLNGGSSSGALAGRGEEATLLSEPTGIRITTVRAIFGGTTYSMRNITSVSMTMTPADRKPGLVLALLGVFVLAFSPPVGALVIILGIVVAVLPKPVYNVRLGSSSGEVRALSSRERPYIESIVLAMNEAIIQRG